MEAPRKQNWHGSLGDEDDVRTSNTRIAQRKRAIPHDEENNRNIIECCNHTRQGMPRTGKQTCAYTSNLGNASHVTCYINNVKYRPIQPNTQFRMQTMLSRF